MKFNDPDIFLHPTRNRRLKARKATVKAVRALEERAHQARNSKPRAIFYLSDHTGFNFQTDKLRELMARAETVYIEPGLFRGPSGKVDLERLMAPQFANVPPKLKRIIFQNEIFCPFNWDKEALDARLAYLTPGVSLATAVEKTRRFWTMATPFCQAQEEAAAREIVMAPSCTLVLYGVGHPGIESAVHKIRPTEIHYPWPDYPGPDKEFEVLMSQEFRETGVINTELALRTIINEQVIRFVHFLCPSEVPPVHRFRMGITIGNNYTARIPLGALIEYHAGLAKEDGYMAQALSQLPRTVHEQNMVHQRLLSEEMTTEETLSTMRQFNQKRNGDYFRALLGPFHGICRVNGIEPLTIPILKYIRENKV